MKNIITKIKEVPKKIRSIKNVTRKGKGSTAKLVLINVNLILFLSSVTMFGFASNMILKDVKSSMMKTIETKIDKELEGKPEDLLFMRDELSKTKYKVESEEREVNKKKILSEVDTKLKEYEALLLEDKKTEDKIREEFEYAMKEENVWTLSIDNVIELKNISSEYGVNPHTVIKSLPVYKDESKSFGEIVKQTAQELLRPSVALAEGDNATRSGGARIVGATTSSNITSLSGLAGSELESMLQGNMSGLGQAFADMEATYGVNAIYAISVAQHESGHGSSGLAQGNNNLFGIKGGSGWRSYQSKYDSIMDFGRLMNGGHYIGGGRTSVDAIGSVYCEGNTWAGYIKGMMARNTGAN